MKDRLSERVAVFLSQQTQEILPKGIGRGIVSIDMYRAFLSFLAASLIILTTTFGGMALFGMDIVMGMGHEACMGMDCGSTQGATSGMNCLDHCLSTVPSASPATAFALAVAFAVVLVAFFVSQSFYRNDRLVFRSRRWREGIGKLLRQQILATVILRN